MPGKKDIIYLYPYPVHTRLSESFFQRQGPTLPKKKRRKRKKLIPQATDVIKPALLSPGAFPGFALSLLCFDLRRAGYYYCLYE